jgi:ferredoxin-NADP reductase
MAAPTERFDWQEAAVVRIAAQTGRVKSFFLQLPKWSGFMAGQHVDVRLTAPDGYQAQRSYSLASAPEDQDVELVVERLEEGEVSPFFHEVVAVGDTVEVRGPIGGYFTWGKRDGGPLLLVGGGSGVVPLVSILRHRANVAPDVPAVLVYSSRAMDEVIFMDELIARAEAEASLRLVLTLTRETATDVRFRSGRIDMPLFEDVLGRFGGPPRHTFVCGATAFVDAASRFLIDAGVPFPSIKTERYGGDPVRD